MDSVFSGGTISANMGKRFARNPAASIDDLMPWSDVMYQLFGL